jgi:thioredoxin 1
MASSHITAVTTANFEAEVVQSPLPVLVDFWAEWCGPCKMIAPLLDEIANENVGQLKIVKANVDEDAALAEKFGIRSIPTLIFFKGGEKKEQVIGLLSKKDLLAKFAALA